MFKGLMARLRKRSHEQPEAQPQGAAQSIPVRAMPTVAAVPPTMQFPGVNRRTAVLVVHGMGAQKPYTTLDQFGRGLNGFFSSNGVSVQREVRFRHHAANPNTKETDWTQAFLRLTPEGATNADQVVDVFEYYWAPVITGLVSAKQSLQFLIFSALTPFQYLRDNLILINELNKDKRQAAKGREKLKIYGSTTLQSVYVLAREFARMLFIFLPLIAAFGLLYALVAQPILTHITSSAGNHTALGIQNFFSKWPLTPLDIVWLVLYGLRYLFLAMSGLFLFEEFFAGHDGKSRSCSPLPYRIIMSIFFAVLAFGPLVKQAAKWLLARLIGEDRFMFADQWLHLHWVLVVVIAAAVLVLLIGSCSSIARDAEKRAYLAIKERHLALTVMIVAVLAVCLYLKFLAPAQWDAIYNWVLKWMVQPLGFVRWSKVAEYAFLAVLLYLVNGFLTTAIAGLAVYLGADDLSKNYAARSQILHECTATLLDLLKPQKDLGGGNVLGNRYDRVLIAAHSLGTVISYDMLNQLIVRRTAADPADPMVDTDLTRIKGLLTFGSPLNKVMYFFRARTSRSTTILERVLFQLHPFRLRVPLSEESNVPKTVPFPFPILSPFGGADEFRWRNAYSPFDLISGKMFFYHADCNARIERGVMPWTAHLSYWENPDLYTYFGGLL